VPNTVNIATHAWSVPPEKKQDFRKHEFDDERALPPHGEYSTVVGFGFAKLPEVGRS